MIKKKKNKNQFQGLAKKLQVKTSPLENDISAAVCQPHQNTDRESFNTTGKGSVSLYCFPQHTNLITFYHHLLVGKLGMGVFHL